MTSKKQGLIYMRDAKNTEMVLKVKRENISTERNFKITEQEMKSNKGKNHHTNFYHNGSDGLSFSCTILFTKKETTTMKRVDAWYREMHPFTIVFGKHLNIKLPLVSKKWIISKLTFKQEADNIVEWAMTFRTYNPPKKIKQVKNNLVDRTSKSYKWKKNCKKHYWKLNFEKQAKRKWPKSNCVKLLNSILIELGYMKKLKKKVKTGKQDKNGNDIKKKVKYVPDTWVHGPQNKGNKTSSGVKKFKKAWNKYKLKPKIAKNKKGEYTDKIDVNTFKAIGNYKKLKNAKKKK